MKRITIICTACVSLLLTACSGKDMDDKVVEEVLDKPEVVTVAGMNQSNETEDTTVKVLDGYRVIDFGGEDIYIPYIRDEDKVPGVKYIEDNYEMGLSTRGASLKAYNKPDGTSVAAMLSGGMGFSKAWNPNSPTGGCSEHVLESREVYGRCFDEPNSYDENKEYEYTFSIFDVQAISFLLNESFYEKVPEVTVKIYGVTNKVWDSLLGSQNKFSPAKFNRIHEELEQSNFNQLPLLASRNIDKTGVYYVDYNEWNADNTYKQFFIVIEMKGCVSEYAYCVDGSFYYDIDSKEIYNTWKAQHSSQMIGG